MDKIINKIKKKAIKIKKIKEKIEKKLKNKEKDLASLFCYFTNDFMENDFDKIKLNDILVIFSIDEEGEFIAWDIKVKEISSTYIICFETEKFLMSIDKDDCKKSTSISTFLTEEKYKKLARKVNISHWERRF